VNDGMKQKGVRKEAVRVRVCVWPNQVRVNIDNPLLISLMNSI
jgi:hypothetical protein